MNPRLPVAAGLIVTLLGLPHPGTGQEAPGAAAFKRLDKNADGKLSRDEAPSAESFAAADSNKDGAVTREEFARYLAARNRPATPTPPPAQPARTTDATPAPVNGKPVLKTLPDSDAVRDAAGSGQLFECVHVPGLTDIRKGVNGFAFADLNRDGRPDFIATVSPPVSLPGVAGTCGACLAQWAGACSDRRSARCSAMRKRLPGGSATPGRR